MRNHPVTHHPDPIFRALADPTRRAVLDLLRHGQQPAGAIARAFPVSRPAISKHLRLLRQARLVREQRNGRRRFYHLEPQPLRAVDHWLEHYRLFWQTKLSSLKAFVEASEPKSPRKSKHNEEDTHPCQKHEKQKPAGTKTAS
jgi:DNA-binding transcriptional ArsR family regulator